MEDVFRYNTPETKKQKFAIPEEKRKEILDLFTNTEPTLLLPGTIMTPDQEIAYLKGYIAGMKYWLED